MSFPGLAEELQGGFADLAGTLVYRSSVQFDARLAAGVTAGATAITLGTLPSGMTGIEAGDTFGGGLYAFASDVGASGGSIADAPFTPALAGSIAAGAGITVVRVTDTECQGWVEWLNAPARAQATILANSLPFTPKDGHSILEGGVLHRITQVGRDAAGAAWLLQLEG